MTLMRARHKVFGVADVPDTDYYRETGWVQVSDDTPTRVEQERVDESAAYLAAISFDPAAHNVDEVVAHLETAPEEEAARVLEVEKSGKARKSVIAAGE